MNETIHPERAPEVPWPTSGHRVLVPDTSMLPGSEKPASELGERVCAARDAVSAKSDQLRDTLDEWVEGVRLTVRANPLSCVVAAAAVGAVIARISRWR